MKVLISDKISDEGVNILKKAGLEVDIKPGLSEDELIAIIGNYDAQIVRSQTKDTAKIIEAAKKMKIIGRAGVGVDNVDVEAATKRGIVVVNSPEGNTIAAAELSLALLLSMARNIPMAYLTLKEKKWDRSKFTGVEVYNKTLGVIGLGKIGSRVAKYAAAMGMKILGFDPFINKEFAQSMGIELMSLAEIYQQADFITLHLPKTTETTNLINKETFAKMKKGVRIVNCARGGIINEQDLVDAIDAGIVAAAAVDVFTTEPIDPENPLLKSDKIVFTPHLGASTEEAQENVALDVAEQIVEVLVNRGQARSAVNIPALTPEKMKPVAKFMPLAEKLGKAASQLAGEAVSEINVDYCGELAAHDVSPVTIALLKGFLDVITPDAVNFVNAPLLAKERGLKVVESKTGSAKDFANLISITIKTESKTKTISGTYSESMGEMIVEIDGYKVTARPESCLLVFPNKDVPGVIGKVGTLLGQHKVNIASMNVGRASVGGDAIMVLNVDSCVDKAVLKALEKIEGITGEAKLVAF